MFIEIDKRLKKKQSFILHSSEMFGKIKIHIKKKKCKMKLLKIFPRSQWNLNKVAGFEIKKNYKK